ncbi:MAG: twin-arginine translocation signal domain-containing protein, partial [Betaproteobacteria bacterium]|nr:twin-arginine translocation signal domain-containing protein [Betaproteobacteria bacterium]
MSHINRRKFLQSTSAAAGAATGPMIWTKDAQAQWSNTPEKGAQLRVL